MVRELEMLRDLVEHQRQQAEADANRVRDRYFHGCLPCFLKLVSLSTSLLLYPLILYPSGFIPGILLLTFLLSLPIPGLPM